MRKIVVANRKGGVGKSTTAVHLAAGLAQVEKRVLLIDTDTQAHCSRMLGVTPAAGLADLIDGADSDQVVTPAREGLDLLAGSRALAGISKDIARKDYDSQYVLRDVLAPYEGRYDYVILDTSPGYGVISINVLFYAEEILVPVSMEVLAVTGFVDFLEELEPIKERSGVTIRYILPTFADWRVAKTGEILAELEDHFPKIVCSPIRYSSAISVLPKIGKLAWEHDEANRAGVDYAKLVGRVVRNGKA